MARCQRCFSTLPAKTKPSLSLSNGRDALSGSSLNLIVNITSHSSSSHPYTVSINLAGCFNPPVSSAVTRSKYKKGTEEKREPSIDQHTVVLVG